MARSAGSPAIGPAQGNDEADRCQGGKRGEGEGRGLRATGSSGLKVGRRCDWRGGRGGRVDRDDSGQRFTGQGADGEGGVRGAVFDRDRVEVERARVGAGGADLEVVGRRGDVEVVGGIRIGEVGDERAATVGPDIDRGRIGAEVDDPELCAIGARRRGIDDDLRLDAGDDVGGRDGVGACRLRT